MGTKLYMLNRSLLAFFTVIVVIVIAYVLVHATPGDPAMFICGPEAPEEALQRMRVYLGLDKPLHEQLLSYIGRVLRGDLGHSWIRGQSVAQAIAERLPNTAALAFGSTIFSVSLGIVLGVLSSKKPHSILDNVLSTISLLGYSIPSFWLAQVFIIVFALGLGWFPAIGVTSLKLEHTGINYIIDMLHHMVLPTVSLTLFQLGLIQRNTRACMLEALGKDYITWARAKGLSETTVFFRHALRNVMLPIVTITGMTIARLLGGTIVIEQIFSYPGLGSLLVRAIISRDYPLVVGEFIFLSSVTVVGTIIVDIIYSFLDPRIKY